MSYTQILEEYRTPTKTVFLEKHVASDDWQRYAVKTFAVRKFGTEQEARAEYDKAIKKRSAP